MVDAWNNHKIKKAQEMWHEGSSAAEIAEAIGVTRSAVLGFAHRNRDAFPNKVDNSGYRARKIRKTAVYAPKPAPEIIPVIEFNPIGIPLSEIEKNQCKFIIEGSLMCGHPAVGSWCPHHKSIIHPAKGVDTRPSPLAAIRRSAILSRA